MQFSSETNLALCVICSYKININFLPKFISQILLIPLPFSYGFLNNCILIDALFLREKLGLHVKVRLHVKIRVNLPLLGMS